MVVRPSGSSSLVKEVQPRKTAPSISVTLLPKVTEIEGAVFKCLIEYCSSSGW